MTMMGRQLKQAIFWKQLFFLETLTI